MLEKFTEGAIKVIMLSQKKPNEWAILLLGLNNYY